MDKYDDCGGVGDNISGNILTHSVPREIPKKPEHVNVHDTKLFPKSFSDTKLYSRQILHKLSIIC